MFFRDEDILYIEQVTNVMHILTHLCYKMWALYQGMNLNQTY